MSVENLWKLMKHEWLQYICSKRQVAHNAGSVLLLFAYMIGVFALAGYREEYISSQLMLSLGDRFPGCDKLTLVRIAFAETAFPGLLTLAAAVWPGLQTTMSVTGEKDKKTLECLFLIPVSDKEVLLAKVASAALPAAVATWLSYGITVLIASGFMSTELAGYLLNSRLLMVSFLAVPILAVLSALGGILVSISVADSKTALGLGYLPGVAGLVCFGLLYVADIAFTASFVILVTLLITGLCVLMLGVAVSRFDRERILLRFS